MPATTHRTKEAVRDWLDERSRADDAPPSPEEVRRQLGWDLIPANRRPALDGCEEPRR